MAEKTDKRQKTLESLRIDLAEMGDEIWNERTVQNLDDDALNEGGHSAASQHKAATADRESHDAADQNSQIASSDRPSTTAPKRPARATKFRTREEIFEHRMTVMAHRRAQLDAHRNRQTRKWFAFSCAMLFIGVSGLGGFYYKSNNWKFLSSYNPGTSGIQNVEIASIPREVTITEQSSSSHFQNASALAILYPATVEQPVQIVTDIPVVETPQQLETVVEKIAEQAPREPVSPQVKPQTPPAPKRSVAKVLPPDPAPQKAVPVARRLVRIVPTAMPAAPETVYNLNKAQTEAARNNSAGEWVMVPVETETTQPTQAVASLSPRITEPKTKSVSRKTSETTRNPDDAAIETAVSLPPKALALDNSALAEETSADGLLGSLLAKDGKDLSVLLERGDQLLLLGDIVSARQLYQHAFQQGNPRAAARIGTTYDPRIFAQLGVHGLKPDSKMALEWYTKAVNAGDESARQTAQTLSVQISKP